MMLKELNNPKFRICTLLCFHHSGGNSNIFKSWASQFEADGISVLAVNLPGRYPRDNIDEQMNSISALAGSISKIVEESRNIWTWDGNMIPLVIFGHSLGGIFAFEVAFNLQHMSIVNHIIISGAKSPEYLTAYNLNPATIIRSEQSDEDLFRFFIDTGGLPKGVHPDFLRATLPVLRRDYRLYEMYRYPESRPQLTAPITTMIGTKDSQETIESIQLWRDFTTGSTSHIVFEGGNHMFIVDPTYTSKLLETISDICFACVAVPQLNPSDGDSIQDPTDWTLWT
jgi:surfactin synthase thioesterase subunit